MQHTPLLTTVNEARQILRISEKSLYNLFTRGELPKVKVGDRTFIRTADIHAFINRQVVKEAA